MMRLLRFLWERFPPLVYLPLVAAFTLGNAAVVHRQGAAVLPAGAMAVLILGVLACFLRLRIFDELKDETTDRREHPERPLPRGLVRRGELHRLALALLLVEGLVAWRFQAQTAWAAVAVWSLLMRREFFCGAWLRPRMELYAVSHTLIAAGLGAWIAASVAGLAMVTTPAVLALMLLDWASFNLYEFARKTWAAEEEPVGDSYSQRWGRAGAVGLSLSQLFLALALAWWLLADAAGLRWGLIACAVIGCAAGVVFAIRPQPWSGRGFRAVMGLELLAVFVVLAGAWL